MMLVQCGIRIKITAYPFVVEIEFLARQNAGLAAVNLLKEKDGTVVSPFSMRLC